MEIVRIGGTELTPEEAYKLYQEQKYIVNYGGVWELHYSPAQWQVYGRKIYNHRGLARRGRYYAMDGDTVNRLIGFRLVRTERNEETADAVADM